MKITKERWQEVVRFCIVGGISFLIDYGLLYFCTEYMRIPYLYSAAISFTVSLIINYWMCLQFVFKGAGEQNKKQATIFIGSSIIGLALNQICMWSFVELLGMYYMMAKIFATAIVTVWNYVMKRKAINNC